MASKSEGSDERPLAILSAPGSRGDVNPMLAIGRRLRQHGFDCLISLAEPYAPLATAAGLTPLSLIGRDRFDELLGSADIWRPLTGLRMILEGAAGEFLQPHLEAILRWKRPGRTVLVSHPLDFASRIHRDLDPATPLVDIFLSPAMVRDPQHPPRLSPWWFEVRRPPWLVAMSYRLADRWLLDRYVGPSVNSARQRLGLPPLRRIMDRWWLSPDQILSLYPDWFGPTPPPGGGEWYPCGFPLMVNPAEPNPEIQRRIDVHLDRYAGSGNSPIFFTPGTAHRHAQQFFELAISVCRRLDRPAILATSHPEQVPTRLPPTVLAVGYVPLDHVLPRCGAIVHHGGIGTTAQALAAACPQVVLPMAFDQFHNAQRLIDLGVARSLYLPGASRGRGRGGWSRGPSAEERLTDALRDMLDNPAVVTACDQQAGKLAATEPDGAEQAVRRIVTLLKRTHGS